MLTWLMLLRCMCLAVFAACGYLQVWTWGEPWGEFSMQLDRSPRAVPDATDVAKIACGAFHNLALTRCPSLAV